MSVSFRNYVLSISQMHRLTPCTCYRHTPLGGREAQCDKNCIVYHVLNLFIILVMYGTLRQFRKMA